MSRIVLLLLAFLTLGQVAWASDIRILTRSSYLSPDLVRKFQHETGISVITEEVSDHADIMARLSKPDSGLDIAFLPDHHVAGLIETGRLERIWADRLPGFWNIEDPWRSRSFDPRNEYTIPLQWGTTAFAVDTSIHKGDMDSLKLLFDAPPVAREVQFDVEIHFPKENRYRPLGEVSPVIRALATEQFDDYVKRVRIFAHPRLVAELRCLAKASPQISSGQKVLSLAIAQGDVANFLFCICWGTLDHIVHQSARGAGAGLDAAGAFEQFDALFIVHGDHGFGADGQAFSAVVVAVV